MNKVFGWSHKEITDLLNAVEKSRAKGERTCKVFEEYAKSHGRAKGSVRNFYYRLANEGKINTSLNHKFEIDKRISVVKIDKFDDMTSRWLLKEILKGQSEHRPARRIIAELSQGDKKLSERYQNKFRNMKKKNLPLIAEVVRELEKEGVYLQKPPKTNLNNDFLKKSLIKSVNRMVDGIAEEIKKENGTLREAVARLEDENRLLKSKISGFYALRQAEEVNK